MPDITPDELAENKRKGDEYVANIGKFPKHWLGDLYGYQEGPYSPVYFYKFEDMEEGDPNDYKRWRGYLRNNYLQPKDGATAWFVAAQRETGDWLYAMLEAEGALHGEAT